MLTKYMEAFYELTKQRVEDFSHYDKENLKASIDSCIVSEINMQFENETFNPAYVQDLTDLLHDLRRNLQHRLQEELDRASGQNDQELIAVLRLAGKMLAEKNQQLFYPSWDYGDSQPDELGRVYMNSTEVKRTNQIRRAAWAVLSHGEIDGGVHCPAQDVGALVTYLADMLEV